MPADPPSLLSLLQSPGFLRLTAGGVRRSATPAPTPSQRCTRVVVRPLEIQGQRQMQFSYFDEKKDFTKNFALADLPAPTDGLLALAFSALHVTMLDEEIDIHLSKKGKVLFSRRHTAPAAPNSLVHNRPKQLPLPEGRADRVLEIMGIMGPEGRVKPSMRDKFTQINEFIKLLEQGIPASFLHLGRPIEVLDAGCGASYLTIATHHYLTAIKGLPAHVVGVDINDDLIAKSTQRTEQLGASTLEFHRAAITDAPMEGPVDVVLALHACDTASDEALALAIARRAELIMCVPCCHQHLNNQLRAAVLQPILRHGIFRQRMAEMITDGLRALLLRLAGYHTDVIEFVAAEHTPRNVLLRAAKMAGGAAHANAALRQEYDGLKEFWQVTPYLETLLRKQGDWPGE